LLLSALGFARPGEASLKVVATIFPLADMVRQIGGEDVEVATLLPPGASPHTFEPTPAQIRDVANARIFVEVGAGLDTWAAKLRAAQTGTMTVVTVTAGVPLLNAVEHGGNAAGGDPHVWLDPILVRDHMVPTILSALSRAAPGQAASLERRAMEFSTALTRLDDEIRNTLAAATHRRYIAFHPAWRYFGQRYDLEEIATVETFPGKEPSAREIAAVVERARAAGSRVLLIEPQFNPRVAEQIAREFGGGTLVVDPLGGPSTPGRTHYVDLMRYNSRVFSQALQ